MPFVLLIVGALVIASSLKGTAPQLGAQIVSDLKGSAGNVGFAYWVAALIIVGTVGYYAPLRKFSHAFMVLIILGMVLATKGGIFSQLLTALKNPVEAKPTQTGSSSTSGVNVSSLTSGSASLAQGASLLSGGSDTVAAASSASDLASMAPDLMLLA